jgi:hypothetical protein
VPELSEVRDEVATEWSAAKRREAYEEFYENLAERYDIRIEEMGSESPEPAEPAENDAGAARSPGALP